MPGPLVTPFRFLAFVARNFMRHDGLENAKSLTFTSLFAVVPLLTLTVAILSAFPSFQVFGTQVQGAIYNRLLPSTSAELEAYLTGFSGQARNLTWAGAVMLLVTAYLMLVNVERNFNRIWGVGEQRKGIASFLLYWSVLSLGPLLLGLGFAISSYVTSLELFEAFTDFSDVFGARSLMLGLFPLVLSTLGFTLLYVAVPNCGVRFRHALYGGLAVALTFVVVKWIFTTFIAGASYQLIYGTFAAVPIFLMWIYVCWTVILFGANLVRAFPLYGSSTGTEDVHPVLLLLALLHRLWQQQQSGGVVKISDLLAEKWPFRSVSADALLSFLESHHLVQNLKDDEYLLARDLESIHFWELLQSSPWPMPTAHALDRPLPAIIQSELPGHASLLQRFRDVEGRSASVFADSLGAWFRSDASHQAAAGVL